MQGEEAFQTSFQLSRQLFSLHHFGWAFLLAWVFCVFYTNELEGYIGSQSTAQANTIDFLTFFFYACLPLAASDIMLVIIVVCEKRLGSPSSHPKLFWIAPLSTSFATSLLFMNGGSPFIADLCFLVGSALTGFGSALLWVLWGEYYARISREEGETLGPVSGVIAAILVLIVSSMSGWVAVAVVVFFPLLSGVCLMLSWHDVENEWPDEYLLSQDVQHTRDRHVRPLSRVSSVLKSLGRTGIGLFAACLLVSLAGGFWEFPSEDVLLDQIILLVSILFMVAISLVVTTGPRRISMSFLYRWMCPAIVVAFAAIIIGGIPWGIYVATLVSIAARFAFCIIVQLYFANYAKRGLATPTQSYGLGWLFVHAGDLAGLFVYYLIENVILPSSITLAQVSALCIVLVVVIVMFVLNDRQSFSSGSGVQEDENMHDVLLFGEVSRGENEVPDRADSALKASDSKAEGETQRSFEERIAEIAKSYGLTPREIQVFDFLARGRSIPYIRDTLVISRETAATHAKHVYAKLKVHSRQELIDLVNDDACAEDVKSREESTEP